jgi:EAL and modified HD-GYP domain-containing signal transduction protein
VTQIFLARQPIVDRDQAVDGYELLYPHDDAEPSCGDDDARATARVAVTALSDIGLERLVGQSRAWISVTPEFLRLGLIRNLPADRVVLELPAARFADPSTLDLIGELRDAGYSLALNQFRYAPEFEHLLELVDIVKLDMVALGAREIARQAFRLGPYGVKLVAEKVETVEDFKLASAAGTDLFQGYFFCRPQTIVGRAIAPSRLAIMQLASALRDPAIELADLERLISGDVALSYRLLKYINSAYFGLRGQISSIQQAVALLGIERLRDWSTLTVFERLSDKPRELFVTALIRAHFCQHAGQVQDGSPAELFTLGLFSVLDALNDTPMRIALEGLPLTPSMRAALVDRTGAGRLLACVTAIEQGDFRQASEILADSSEHYLDSVAWSNDAAKQLIG